MGKSPHLGEIFIEELGKALSLDEMGFVMRNRSSQFPTRSDTNQAVQPQKMARGLKFQILEVEGLYYIHVA